MDLNEDSFHDLFDILLPYFAKWKELKNYPKAIKENSNLIIKCIKNAKWDNAEKYIYRYFGYLIKRVCEQLWPTYYMSINSFLDSILKWVPNKYMQSNKPSWWSDDIKNLHKHYTKN